MVFDRRTIKIYLLTKKGTNFIVKNYSLANVAYWCNFINNIVFLCIMNNPLYQFFTNDHRRIEMLLEKAIEDVNAIQMDYYHEFRSGLLKHIKMEEKILFPAAQKANGGIPLPLAAKLRLDHGALTSLMVVPPEPGMIKVLCHVLELHDILEEKPGGMYDLCEKLAINETQALLDQLTKITEVPVQPHNKAEYALGAAKRALERAGFDYDTIAK
jgi:hypothetical protein